MDAFEESVFVGVVVDDEVVVPPEYSGDKLVKTAVLCIYSIPRAKKGIPFVFAKPGACALSISFCWYFPIPPCAGFVAFPLTGAPTTAVIPEQ